MATRIHILEMLDIFYSWLLNIDYYAKTIYKASSLTTQIFSRVIERKDNSQLQRNNRHQQFYNYFIEGNIYEKVFGIYPSIGNSSKLIKTNKVDLFKKNPESYYLKLIIERGFLGLLLFSFVQLIFILKIVIFLKNFILVNLKKENYKFLYNYEALFVNFTLLGVFAVLFNLQFLDSPLGSLLFALLTNECLNLNSKYYERILFYKKLKKSST